MTPLVLASIIAQYGLPLAQQLFALHQAGNKPLTQADFDALVALSNYSSTQSLAVAGIKIVDGKVVPVT